MRKHYLLFLSLLFASLYLASADMPSLRLSNKLLRRSRSRWSDPATWPGRKVPAAGDKVTIEKGKDVVLDVSPPALNGLTIEGKLSFADNKDLELTTEWIMVHGELEIGTERPTPHAQGDHYPHRQRQRRRYEWNGWNE